mmetsp:Transcript_65735/g.152734  ORF Transcript_65735/g.152734 Transcript_65735/m.152734 type:complete len:205 (+) Transcript_65735:590-1204(+)
MCARDGAKSKDHDHQRCSNGENRRLGASKDVEADSEHQHVGAEEFAQQPAEHGWLLFCGLVKVVGPASAEQASGEEGAHHLKEEVGPEPTKSLVNARGIHGKRHSRVEATTGDAASPVTTGDNGEANGQTVELILAAVALRGSGVQHCEAQHEGVERLCKARLPPFVAGGRHKIEGVVEEPRIANARKQRSGELSEDVQARLPE